MADSVSILQELRENNPFLSASSPLPWDNDTSDIQNLNRDTSEEIEQLIRQKRRQPSLPLAGLILGVAGSGKTHMLTRILRRLRDNAQPAVFVAIRTFRDAESVVQHILSEIFISLKLIHSGGRSQFDIIISQLMTAYDEKRRTDGFDSTEKLDMRYYLSKDMPGIDRNFLKCVMLYMSAHDEKVKADILDWLSFRLSDDDSSALGLPSIDMSSMSEARREQEAEKVLLSLGLVLGYAKVPMVICFDELDAMRDKKVIDAWGSIISLIMNNLRGVLPLCFLRAETWDDVFRPVLEESVVQRLSNNIMTMKTCSVEQAHQLIRSRIESAFKDSAEEIYNWLAPKVPINQEYSPRRVIETVNNFINTAIPEGPKKLTPSSDSVFRTISENYADSLKKIHDEPYAWPPDVKQLTLALEVWLSSREGVTVAKSSGKYIRLKGCEGERKFAFIIVTPKNHFTATSAVSEGMRFMADNPGSFCCYVLDEKSHKDTWKKFYEKLKEFEDSGGFTVRLDKKKRADWYALTDLINRVDNGDINIYLDSSSRTATREDLNAFVRTLTLVDMNGLKNPVEHTETQTTTEGTQIEIKFDTFTAESLYKILQTSAMNIMNPDKASELLDQEKGIKLTRNDVIALAKSREEMFRIFGSNDNILIGTA